MANLVVSKSDSKLIESTFMWDENNYTIRFIGYEDTIWCHSLMDMYIALNQFRKYGKCKTDIAGYVIA